VEDGVTANLTLGLLLSGAVDYIASLMPVRMSQALTG
jgi:hypothetical protein